MQEFTVAIGFQCRSQFASCRQKTQKRARVKVQSVFLVVESCSRCYNCGGYLERAERCILDRCHVDGDEIWRHSAERVIYRAKRIVKTCFLFLVGILCSRSYDRQRWLPYSVPSLWQSPCGWRWQIARLRQPKRSAETRRKTRVTTNVIFVPGRHFLFLVEGLAEVIESVGRRLLARRITTGKRIAWSGSQHALRPRKGGGNFVFCSWSLNFVPVATTCRDG